MQEAELNLEGMRLIPGRNKGKYPFCHSLLIEDEIKAVIDPASDPDVLKEVAESKKVDVVILSHYHEDHFWFSYLFPKAELWIHELDAPCMESVDILLDAYRMEGERREEWKNILIGQFHYQPCKISRCLKEGDKISFGKTEMVVLHTPGHTPGHCSFYFPAKSLIYLSDLDLTKFGPYYGDRGSDIDKTISSTKRLAEIECDTYVASHERAIYKGSIKKEVDDYLLVIDERENKLRELLREPRTIDEIVEARIIYKKPREPKSFYDFGEWAMITKHLERMMRKGELIVLDNEKYYFPDYNC